MNKTRILSIDGGGIKGIISAMVLVELESLLQYYSGNKQARLSDYFEIIGGTSTGAILAAIYLCPDENHRPKYSAKDALELYLNHGKEIFKRRRLYPLNTIFGLFGPKYNNTKLEVMLKKYLGDVTLTDLVKPCVFTAYNTEKRRSVFFNSLSCKSPNKKDHSVISTVLASTAAPTYFRPIQIGEHLYGDDCYIDGGVFAGNPTMCALIEGLKLPNCGGFEQTYILSVGNVSNLEPYSYTRAKGWGKIGWALPLLDILMDASAQTVDYQICKIFHTLGLDQNYLRIQLNIDESTPAMDNVSEESFSTLMGYGEQLIHQSYRKMVEFARSIV